MVKREVARDYCIYFWMLVVLLAIVLNIAQQYSTSWLRLQTLPPLIVLSLFVQSLHAGERKDKISVTCDALTSIVYFPSLCCSTPLWSVSFDHKIVCQIMTISQWLCLKKNAEYNFFCYLQLAATCCIDDKWKK